MQEINPTEYYTKRLGALPQKSARQNGINVICPFHSDKAPSLSLNLDTGLWFCHSEKIGGNITEFEAKLRNTTTKEAFKSLITEFNLETDNFIDDNLVSGYHDNLIQNPKAIQQLEISRGIKLETIKKYRLGLDTELKRLTIPIYIYGVCRNIRKWKSGAIENKVIGIKDHNHPLLYPTDNLKEDTIYIMEGEMDCLLANQLGLNAITVTSGAGTWKEEWNQYFIDKNIITVYDIDQAGIDGAKKICNILKDYGKTIKNIELPISDPPNGDFTDYIITHGFTIEQFLQLVKDTPCIDNVPKEPTATKISLMQSSNAIYYNQYIEVPITMAGKNYNIFHIPATFKIKCSKSKKKCSVCPAGLIGELIVKVNKTDEVTLKLININEFQLTGALRDIAGVICQDNKMEIIDKQPIEEIIAIPEVNFNADISNSDYLSRTLYYAGFGLSTNKSYNMRGYLYTNPINQHATILIQKAIATQGNLDPSNITKEIKQELKVFQCQNDIEIIKNKFEEIHTDIAYNVTKIFDRNDMTMAIDLAYHSVLSFDFCNTYVHKGWIDCLVIGDTRNGKSITIQGMIKHYKAGEIVGGDNLNEKGLIGACIQLVKGWTITWGKMVLNNGGLIAIDELSGMAEKEDFGKLTGIRSTGVAEINKVVTAKAVARTRFLCFSNPLSGRKLNTYDNGIIAVRELIGKLEDISRFDYAVTVADGEVDQVKINEYFAKEIPHKYTSNLCHWLVLWAWTRKREDVVFANGSEKVILDLSLLMSQIYDSSIPLVAPAEQRVKLARVAVAVAARLYSTDEEGEKVIIYPEHVQVAYDFMTRCYNKPSMGYDLYSNIHNKSWNYITTNYESLKKEFKSIFSGNDISRAPDWKRLKDVLLEYQIIRKSELELHMKWDIATIKSFFDFVLGKRLMINIHNGYVKHPLFIKLLKEIEKDEEEI